MRCGCNKVVSKGGLEPPRPIRALAPQASASAIPPLRRCRPIVPNSAVTDPRRAPGDEAKLYTARRPAHQPVSLRPGAGWRRRSRRPPARSRPRPRRGAGGGLADGGRPGRSSRAASRPPPGPARRRLPRRPPRAVRPAARSPSPSRQPDPRSRRRTPSIDHRVRTHLDHLLLARSCPPWAASNAPTSDRAIQRVSEKADPRSAETITQCEGSYPQSSM